MRNYHFLFFTLVSCASLNAAIIGYVSDGLDIYQTDFETGVQTPLTLFGLATNVDYFEALDISPVDSCLYAVGHWEHYLNVGGRQIERSLYRIDVSSGQVTNNVAFLSAGHGLYELLDLAISSDGIPYAIELPRMLYALVEPPDPPSYVGVTFLGQLDVFASALAIDPSGSAVVWGNDKLWSIDLSDLSDSFLTNLPGDFSALDYGPDDTLYAWGSNTLYRIDLPSGTAAAIRTLSHGAQGFAIVPEPGTLLLFSLGALAVLRKPRWSH